MEVKDAPPEQRRLYAGLDNAAKFEYGGRKIAEEEFLLRSHDPELHKYLLLEVQDAVLEGLGPFMSILV